MPDAIDYICIYARPPMGPTEGTKQLILPAVPQGVMCVHQQLYMGYEWWNIHPILRKDSRGQEKDLQFFTTCPIHLSQLPKSIILVYILGQPARPEVFNQRLILSYISCSPHSYCALTGLTKPRPAMQTHTVRLSYAVFVVAMVAPVTKYHGG